MNRKSILVIVLVLAVGLAFTLVLGAKKDVVIESNTTGPYVAAESAEAGVKENLDSDVDSTNVSADETEGTEESAKKQADNSKSTESNTNQPTKVTDPNKSTDSEKETESPAIDDDGISDAFIQENVNMGVVKGESSGGDIVLDDKNPPAHTQPPEPQIPTEDNQGSGPVSLTVPLTEITYELYNAMSAAEQQAVIDSFGSMEDFVVWFNYIKAQYELENPDIEIGADGVVDLS